MPNGQHLYFAVACMAREGLHVLRLNNAIVFTYKYPYFDPMIFNLTRKCRYIKFQVPKHHPRVVHQLSLGECIHLALHKAQQAAVDQPEAKRTLCQHLKAVGVQHHAVKKPAQRKRVGGQAIPYAGFDAIWSQQKHTLNAAGKGLCGSQGEFAPQAEPQHRKLINGLLR